MFMTMQRYSYPKNQIKILLLENIHPAAVEALSRENFQVELVKGALSEEELKLKIQDVHALGIRYSSPLHSSFHPFHLSC